MKREVKYGKENLHTQPPKTQRTGYHTLYIVPCSFFRDQITSAVDSFPTREFWYKFLGS